MAGGVVQGDEDPRELFPMSLYLRVHPQNPQPRLIAQAVAAVRQGGVAVYPTDSCYALGCAIDAKGAQEGIRRLRRLPEKHDFTLMCRDLAEAALYARMDNRAYRLLRSLVPGPYTFLLKATREVPRRLQNPKRKTIGIRIPDHPVALALLEALGEPMLSSTLILPGEEHPLTDPDEIRARLEKQVDVIIDAGPGGLEPSTVVDLTGDIPVVVRRGKGPLEALGDYEELQ